MSETCFECRGRGWCAVYPPRTEVREGLYIYLGPLSLVCERCNGGGREA